MAPVPEIDPPSWLAGGAGNSGFRLREMLMTMGDRHIRCAGQSLMEACLAMLMLCLIFMGFFQVSQLIAVRQVLYHAAARGARARMVGFNRFMVEKAVRVAVIPNAGRMTQPDIPNEDAALRDWLANAPAGTVWDRALQSGGEPAAIHEIERVRIPEFMAAPDWSRAHGVLDYEHWNRVNSAVPGMLQDGAPIEVRVRQILDLRRLFGAAVHRAFYARDDLELEGRSRLEAQYPLYIEDRNW